VLRFGAYGLQSKDRLELQSGRAMLTPSGQELAEEQVGLGMAGIERNRLAQHGDRFFYSAARGVRAGQVVVSGGTVGEEPCRLTEFAHREIIGPDSVEVCPQRAMFPRGWSASPCHES